MKLNGLSPDQGSVRVLVCDLSFKESHDLILPHVYGSLRTYVEELYPHVANRLSWLRPIYRWESLEKVELSNIDVLALSCYVWSIESQLELARQFKQLNPNGIVVCGGPEVELNGGNRKGEAAVDFWVYKEGEEPFARILESIVEQGANATRSRRTELELHRPPIRLPNQSPYLLGFYDEILEENKNLTVTAIWETTRGCPFSCSFCNWGSYTSSKVREINFDRLAAEIRWFGDRKIGHLYITDANLGILPRDIKIAQMLVDTNIELGWPKRVWANYNKNTNDRVIQINDLFLSRGMSYSGATISVQSLNSETLTAVGRENIGFKKYLELSDENNRKNVTSYTELILGLPGETSQTFFDGINKLVARGVRNIRMYPALVLQNTDFADPNYQIKYRLKTKPKKLYLEANSIRGTKQIERARVIIETATMTYDEMQDIYRIGHLTQALYCTGLLKTVFDTLLTDQITFTQFLEELESFESPTIKNLFGFSRELVNEQFHSDNTNMFGAQFRDFQFQGRSEKLRAAPWNLIWLWIMLQKEEFFESMIDYLGNRSSRSTSLVREVVEFQKFLLLDMNLWATGRKQISLSQRARELLNLNHLDEQIEYQEEIQKRRDSLNDYLLYSTGSTVVTEFKFLIRPEKLTSKNSSNCLERNGTV